MNSHARDGEVDFDDDRRTSHAISAAGERAVVVANHTHTCVKESWLCGRVRVPADLARFDHRLNYNAEVAASAFDGKQELTVLPLWRCFHDGTVSEHHRGTEEVINGETLPASEKAHAAAQECADRGHRGGVSLGDRDLDTSEHQRELSRHGCDGLEMSGQP